MQIKKVESTLNGDSITCGHFNSSLYDSYIEFPVNLDTSKKYTIHGYIKSSVAGQISCEDATTNVSTEWSHVVMTITPSKHKSLELKFYPGEFWIYEWKLEVGEVNSNWTPSPLDAKYDLISLGSEVQQLSDSITQKVWKEDIDAATEEINKSVTTVGQDAEKIYWLVDKNSKNQASMSLTSDLYKLVAENINLTGKVTFESFSLAMQENWNDLKDIADDASDKASDAADAVNNSISKVVTEYYKSTDSNEPTDGKWSTSSPMWEEGYYIWSRTVSTNLNGDNEVSEPVCITGNNGSDGVGISSIISQYYLSSSSTELKDGSWIDNESPEWVKGKYIWTRSKISWDNGDVTTTTAVLAKALNTANENAVTAWNTTQDIIKNIYVTNKTTINGGRIETGTVTADAIATDAIVSKNYVKDSAGSFLNLADGSFDSKYLKWDSAGDITATSGSIGGWKISDSSISTNFCDKNNIIYNFSLNNASSVEAKILNVTQNDKSFFYIQRDGFIYAKNAELEGTLKNISKTNDYIMTASVSGGEFKIQSNTNAYMVIQGHYLALSNEDGTNDRMAITRNSTTFGSISNAYTVNFYTESGGKHINIFNNNPDENYGYANTEVSLIGSMIAKYSITSYGGFIGTMSSDSDKNVKKDIKALDIEQSANFIYGLIPSEFRMINGTSNRFHHGFIAQEVKENMGDNDWGLFIDRKINEENYETEIIDKNGNKYKELTARYALRYDELIADLVATIQSQNIRIKKLEKILAI